MSSPLNLFEKPFTNNTIENKERLQIYPKIFKSSAQISNQEDNKYLDLIEKAILYLGNPTT